MKLRIVILGIVACSVAWGGYRHLKAADRPPSGDEQAVRNAVAAYTAAHNSGDAKAAARLWTDDGVIVDAAGRSFPGRSLELEALQRGGERPEPLEVTIGSVHMATPDVSIVHGTTSRKSGSALQKVAFTAVWKRKDKEWLLDTLRENPSGPLGVADRLAALDWMIGDWSGEEKGRGILVEMSCQWAPRKTFILREISLSVDGEVIHTLSQRIGWDPASNSIKSWNFDVEGGHGEAVWTKAGDNWTVDAQGIRIDGAKTRATNTYSDIKQNEFIYSSHDATIDGESQPNIEVVLHRE